MGEQFTLENELAETREIDRLLCEAVERGASDLHLTVGLPPVLRLHGELVRLELPPLTPAGSATLAAQILQKPQETALEQRGEVDLAYSLPGVGRFRINVYRQRDSIAIALRVLKEKIPELDALGLPAAAGRMARHHKGLVLVTGPTGSGKSTTLAAMIGLINRERRCHILTLEDPIEYLHHHDRSMINQREIGQDSESFAGGLRAALREDPDVILVGEMRDLETISIAITAAETGHLVLASLHTVDAPQTIDRVIDVFPPHQQQQIRVQMANTLVGIIAQRLMQRRDGQGRVAAVEILIATPAVRNLIREGKIHQIYSVIQTGAKFGMQLMDAHLVKHYEAGLIDHQAALDHAVDPETMAKTIMRPQGAGHTGPVGRGYR